MTYIGTAHYTSEYTARRAYCMFYDDAIAEGRIAIGPPEIKEGDKLFINKEGRYVIGVPDKR